MQPNFDVNKIYYDNEELIDNMMVGDGENN